MSAEFEETHRAETYKSLVTISIEVFRALVLVNGGAAAGMVAAMDRLTKILAPEVISLSMAMFVLGLVAAIAATCSAYFTQLRLHNENIGAPAGRGHRPFMSWAIGLCGLSLLLFSIGAMNAALNVEFSRG